MNLFDTIVLGIVQGLTEFLPISSSGHLVIGQHLLGINLPGNALEIVLHMGTLGSVLVIFWKDLKHLVTTLFDRTTQMYILIIIVGTIPAVLVGLLLKETIEATFDSISLVTSALIVTGVFLLFTKLVSTKESDLNLKNGLIIGLAQALAIVPGISRSGATISTGLLLGVTSEEAARYSFLLAIPAISGAGLLTSFDFFAAKEQMLSIPIMIAGFSSSFLVGWISLKWLLRILQSGNFFWFGVYCIFIGLMLKVF